MSRDRRRVQAARVRPEVVRYALGLLLAFAALNAFGGGTYGMAGARGIPQEWLMGSPFSSYFVPSLFLFTVVGGSFLLAAVAVFRRWEMAWLAAFGAGLMVLTWIVAQVACIGFVSWLQPATVVAGLAILRLALLVS
jgi:hypothetical protein